MNDAMRKGMINSRWIILHFGSRIIELVSKTSTDSKPLLGRQQSEGRQC